jgi:hypothetical protein
MEASDMNATRITHLRSRYPNQARTMINYWQRTSPCHSRCASAVWGVIAGGRGFGTMLDDAPAEQACRSIPNALLSPVSFWS